MQRREFIKNAGLVGGMIALAPLLRGKTDTSEFGPLAMDLHVHLTEKFTIEDLMKIADERKVKFGVLAHPASWGVKDDDDLMKYLESLRRYPVYVGLQPLTPNWAGAFSPALLRQLDYVLMDPQTIPLGNGEYQRIYELETYVEDSEAFMDCYMKHSLNLLRTEPINIFGWTLFLPVCIARDYYTLWTETRMQQIISAAKARSIAIEINDMSHTPHERFILSAKEQGLKFTFGSDSRNANAGRLAYCHAIAKRCRLTPDDFYVPLRAVSSRGLNGLAR